MTIIWFDEYFLISLKCLLCTWPICVMGGGNIHISRVYYIHKYEIKGTFREICTFPPQQRDDNKTCLSPACKTLRKEKLQHRTSSVTSVCHASSLTTCSCAGKSPAFSETSPRMSKTCCVHTIKLSIIISNVSKQINYHQLQVLYDLNLSYPFLQPCKSQSERHSFG